MKTKKELRKEILDFVKSQRWYGQKMYSIPIQKFVHFNAKGVKHSISRNYKFPNIELQLAKNIPSLLSDSTYLGFDKNTNTEDINIKGVHNYYNIILFEQQLYEVWIKIKETRDLTYFYDFGIIRKL